MSALGQQQTVRRCPLYPWKRHQTRHIQCVRYGPI